MRNPDWQHMQRGAPEKMRKWTPKAFEDFAQAENIYKVKKRNKGVKRKEWWAKKQGWKKPQRPDAAPQEEGPPEEPPSKRSKTDPAHQEEAEEESSAEEEVLYKKDEQEAMPPQAMARPPQRPSLSQSSRPVPAWCYVPKAMPLPRPVPLYPRDAAGLTFHFRDGANFFLPEHAAQQLYHSIPKAKLESWGRTFLRRPGQPVDRVTETNPIIEILEDEDESTIRPWKRS